MSCHLNTDHSMMSEGQKSDRLLNRSRLHTLPVVPSSKPEDGGSHGNFLLWSLAQVLPSVEAQLAPANRILMPVVGHSCIDLSLLGSVRALQLNQCLHVQQCLVVDPFRDLHRTPTSPWACNARHFRSRHMARPGSSSLLYLGVSFSHPSCVAPRGFLCQLHRHGHYWLNTHHAVDVHCQSLKRPNAPLSSSGVRVRIRLSPAPASAGVTDCPVCCVLWLLVPSMWSTTHPHHLSQLVHVIKDKRIGEADKPGPQSSQAWAIAAINPTGLAGKAQQFKDLPPGIFAISESHLSARGQVRFREELFHSKTGLKLYPGGTCPSQDGFH